MIALTAMEAGFEPGEHRHYSNIGYRAAGVVLEAVTGRLYGDLVQQRVFDRLGLRDAEPVMTGDTRRRLPGGHGPSTTTGPGDASTGWRRRPGSSPPRPTAAPAAASRTSRPMRERFGKARSCCPSPAWS